MRTRPRTIHLLVACVAAALFITACTTDPNLNSSNSNMATTDPSPGTPEAAAAGDKLMRSMSDTLARSKAFTFETSEQLEVIAPDQQKKTLSFARKVTVRRPNGLFFELHGKGDTALEVAAYYDGRNLALIEKPDGAWAQTTVPATLDWMLDDVARRFGLPVPIGDVIYSSPYDAFIGSGTRGGLVGRETIDGVACSKLDYADDLVQVKLWIPTSGPALPRRLELVYKQAPTPLFSQIDFTNWNLDAPVADATFAFTPPQGTKPAEFGEFVAAMKSRLVPSGRPANSNTVPGSKPAASPGAR